MESHHATANLRIVRRAITPWSVSIAAHACVLISFGVLSAPLGGMGNGTLPPIAAGLASSSAGDAARMRAEQQERDVLEPMEQPKFETPEEVPDSLQALFDNELELVSTVRSTPEANAWHPEEALTTPSRKAFSRTRTKRARTAAPTRSTASVATRAQAGGQARATPLRVVFAPNPRDYYPSEARRDRRTGTVLVRITIGTRGDVVDARVVTSSHDDALDRAALRLARAYRFARGPVRRTTRLPVVFRLTAHAPWT